MLLTIAFLVFIAQIVAWLLLPSSAGEPAPLANPERATMEALTAALAVED